MTEKRFQIIDKQFISYYGGNGHLISNGNCKFWLWHDESGSQKVCDKLNIIMEENEQLKEFKDGVFKRIDDRIAFRSHKPYSISIGQPMSVNFDEDMDRLARLSELLQLKEELKGGIE